MCFFQTESTMAIGELNDFDDDRQPEIAIWAPKYLGLYLQNVIDRPIMKFKLQRQTESHKIVAVEAIIKQVYNILCQVSSPQVRSSE